MFDILVVGSGLFGATIANLARSDNLSVLVLEKNSFVGGGVNSYNKDGIEIHRFGPHIFHSDNDVVYKYFTSFCKLNDFINQPLACYKGRFYHLPFNMNTFKDLWGITTIEEAKAKIEQEREPYKDIEPSNLEEEALHLVGNDIYQTLIKGYSEKQWGKDCKSLPASIIKRIPIRFEYNNNYFNDLYQGVPIEGYTSIINKMLTGCKIELNTNYNLKKDEYDKLAKCIVYTGCIDEYFDYKLGRIEYRTLRFEIERLNQSEYQKAAVINYTEREIPYTRICEYKHLTNTKSSITYIGKEYPKTFEIGDIPFYPINDKRNNDLYNAYKSLCLKKDNFFLGGRLGSYKYNDMDDTILDAMNLYKEIKKLF